jgi:hypothetical protein
LSAHEDERNEPEKTEIWLRCGLVLSEAVLVLAIAVCSIPGVRLGDGIALHRHPSQHRDDPLQLSFLLSFRSSELHLDYEHEHRRKRLSTGTIVSLLDLCALCALCGAQRLCHAR